MFLRAARVNEIGTAGEGDANAPPNNFRARRARDNVTRSQPPRNKRPRARRYDGLHFRPAPVRARGACALSLNQFSQNIITHAPHGAKVCPRAARAFRATSAGAYVFKFKQES